MFVEQPLALPGSAKYSSFQKAIKIKCFLKYARLATEHRKSEQAIMPVLPVLSVLPVSVLGLQNKIIH